MDKNHRVAFTLSAEDFEAIGALAAHYSLMEMLVAVATWHLLKLPAYEGTLITGPLSLKQRFELLIQFAETRKVSASDLAEIRAIDLEFSRDAGITARRNRYIHAVWATGANKETALPINFNKRGKPRITEHLTADDIEAVTRDICAQAKRFLAVLEHWDYVPEVGVSFDPARQPGP